MAAFVLKRSRAGPPVRLTETVIQAADWQRACLPSLILLLSLLEKQEGAEQKCGREDSSSLLEKQKLAHHPARQGGNMLPQIAMRSWT